MSVPVVLNGQTYNIPNQGDPGWGETMTTFIVNLAAYVQSIVISSGGVDLVSNQVVGGVKTFTAGLALAGGAVFTGFVSTGIVDNAVATAVTINADGSVAIPGAITSAGGFVGNASSATKLHTARTIAATGDATGSVSFDGSANVSLPLVLAASGVAAGTYTSLTVNTKGIVTAATNPGGTPVANLGGAPSMQEGTHAARPAAGNTGAIFIESDTQSIFRDTGSVWQALSSGGGAATVTLTGDVTASGATGSPIATTLANSGVTASTYKSLTVNAKGIVTGGTNPTTLAGFGITDGVKNAGGTPQITEGTHAARPAAGTAGAVYIETDTFNIFRDTGASYDQIGGGTPPTLTFTGDATGSGTTAIALTLAASGVAAGTYTSLTVDTKGRVTAGTNPTPPSQLVTLGGDVTGSGNTGTTITTTLASSGISAGTYTAATFDAKGRATTGINMTATGDATGTASGSALPLTLATVNSNVGQFSVHTVNAKGLTTAATNLALTGDITGTASGASLATTLATVNSTVGTFQGMTVNAKGQVTAAVNQSYMQHVHDDTAPQLGGNLDVNGHLITTSVSNGNITLKPNGSGVFDFSGTPTGTAGGSGLLQNVNQINPVANQLIQIVGSGSSGGVAMEDGLGGQMTIAGGSVSFTLSGGSPTFGDGINFIYDSNTLNLSSLNASFATIGQFGADLNLNSFNVGTALGTGFVNAAIVSGGTGYTAGDVLTVAGGTFTTVAQITVGTVSGGVITGAGLTAGGSILVPSGVYSVFPSNPVSVTGGTGTGATFTLTRGAATATINPTTFGRVQINSTGMSHNPGLSAAGFTSLLTVDPTARQVIIASDNTSNDGGNFGLVVRSTAASAIDARVVPTAIDWTVNGQNQSVLSLGVMNETTVHTTASGDGMRFLMRLRQQTSGVVAAKKGNLGDFGATIDGSGNGSLIFAYYTDNGSNNGVRHQGLVINSTGIDANTAQILNVVDPTTAQMASTKNYVDTRTVTATGDATGAITVGSSGALTLAASGISAGTYTAATFDAKGRATSGLNLAATGDATGTASGSSIALTLKNTGTAGTYKSVTTDAQGRVTAGTNPTTLAGYGITDAVKNLGGAPSVQEGTHAGRPAAGNAGAIFVETDTLSIFRDNGTTWDAITSGSGITQLTGDVTAGPGSGSQAATLAASGVTASTYKSVTVNAKGLVTGGSNPTTLAGYGITDAIARSGSVNIGTQVGGGDDYITAQGSSVGVVGIKTNGVSTNIPLYLMPKGTGQVEVVADMYVDNAFVGNFVKATTQSIFLYGDTVTQSGFAFTSGTTPTIAVSSSGLGASVSPAGVANVSLNLTTKGTGVVQANGNTIVTTVPIVGSVTASGSTTTITPGDSATINVACNANSTYTITTGASDGQKVVLRLKQDATGSRTVAFDSSVAFGTDIVSFTATTTALKTDVVAMQYSSALSKWMLLAAVKGY